MSQFKQSKRTELYLKVLIQIIYPDESKSNNQPIYEQVFIGEFKTRKSYFKKPQVKSIKHIQENWEQ